MNEDEAYRALRTRGAQLWHDHDGWRVVIPGSPVHHLSAVVGEALSRRSDMMTEGDAPVSVRAWEVRR